jgi:hypothetical protein
LEHYSVLEEWIKSHSVGVGFLLQSGRIEEKAIGPVPKTNEENSK